MVFKRGQFVGKKKINLAEVAPYFLHLGIVVAVSVYVIVGAYAIREIEAIFPEEPGEVARIKRDSDTSIEDLQKFRRMSMNRTRRCVISALHRIHKLTNCSSNAVEGMHLSFLDSCYEQDLKRFLEGSHEGSSKGDQEEKKFEVAEDGSKRWRVTDSILFCFTVITTIGYGNVAPRSFYGRLFVIFYGLVGVPFTMLAIANLGKFLAALLKSWTRPFIKCFGRIRRRLFSRGYSSKEKQRLMETPQRKSKLEADENDSEGEEEEEEANDEDDDSSDAFVLFFSFIFYIVAGSFVISAYEPQMNFFEAIYFNFVTLTTIGLGDLVPQSDHFLICTLIYCAVGLALTTIAIEIAADTLKKLHYFGRKIENVGGVKVWFGGQQISMKQLVKNLGDQFNVPVDQLQGLDLGKFVDDAMKVESGELTTLRKEQQPYMTSNYWRVLEGSSLHFVDDDDVIAMQAAPEWLSRRAYSLQTESPSALTLLSKPLASSHVYKAVVPRQRDASQLTLISNAKRAAPVMVGAISEAARAEDERLQRLLTLWRQRMNPSPPSTPSTGTDDEEQSRFSEAAKRRYREYQEEWLKYRTTRELMGLSVSPRERGSQMTLQMESPSSEAPSLSIPSSFLTSSHSSTDLTRMQPFLSPRDTTIRRTSNPNRSRTSDEV